MNLSQRTIFSPNIFEEALYINIVNNSFYIFSIVLISSVLAPPFLKFAEDGEIEFRKLKLGFVIFSIFIMLFGSVFYSVYTSKFEIPIPDSRLHVDWWQLSFFILSLLIAVYSFGIKLIDDNPDENNDIREKSVKKKVKENVIKAEELTKTGDVDL